MDTFFTHIDKIMTINMVANGGTQYFGVTRRSQIQYFIFTSRELSFNHYKLRIYLFVVGFKMV